jgi:hypothetical protein
MPNNKTISEIPSINCKACLIRTFSEPDLRLMELEKNSIKKIILIELDPYLCLIR